MMVWHNFLYKLEGQVCYQLRDIPAWEGLWERVKAFLYTSAAVVATISSTCTADDTPSQLHPKLHSFPARGDFDIILLVWRFQPAEPNQVYYASVSFDDLTYQVTQRKCCTRLPDKTILNSVRWCPYMTLNYLRGLEESCMQLNQQKPANHLAAYCKTANKSKSCAVKPQFSPE